MSQRKHLFEFIFEVANIGSQSPFILMRTHSGICLSLYLCLSVSLSFLPLSFSLALPFSLFLTHWDSFFKFTFSKLENEVLFLRNILSGIVLYPDSSDVLVSMHLSLNLRKNN